MALASAQRRAKQMKTLRIQAGQAKKAELEENRQRLFEKQLLLEALQARRDEETKLKKHYLATGEWLQRARGSPSCPRCLAVQHASNSKQGACGACLASLHQEVGCKKEPPEEYVPEQSAKENLRHVENQMVMGATLDERVQSVKKLAELRHELANLQCAARLEKKKVPSATFCACCRIAVDLSNP